MKNNISSLYLNALNMLTVAFAALVLLLSITPQVSAAVPGRIYFQGKLLDTGSDPRSGSFDLTFRIYDALSGGSVLWTEAQPGITVNNGVFSVQLGSVTAIPLAVLNEAAAYLEVQVGAESASPRERLIAAPYALRAAETESLMSGAGGVYWTLSNGTLYPENPAYSIGLGTAAPAYRLHVASAAGETGTILAVSTGDTNVFWVAGDGAHAVKFHGDGSSLTGLAGVLSGGQAPQQPYWTSENTLGNSGLSRDSAASLTVAGATFTVQGNAFSVGGSTFVVSNGNVGVRTTSPKAQLDIRGTADNSGPASLRLSGATADNGYVHEETFRINGITSAAEISRITGTGSNGMGMAIEIVVSGHTGAQGDGMVRGIYFYQGGTGAPATVEALTAGPRPPAISFDAGTANVLLVKLASWDGTSTFKGVMNIRWYVPLDLADNTWTVQ